MMRKAFTLAIVSLFIISGLIGMFLMVSDDAEGPGPTYVSGIISSDTIWYLADSPYIVTGNILVEENFTLTIEPGVAVKFDTDKYLRVDGTFHAVGNETQIILFTSNNSSPAPGDWGGIRITSTSVDSIIKYCKIEFGGGLDGGGLNNVANGLEISYCYIENNFASDRGGGIYNTASNFKISYCRIKNNSAGVGGGICNLQGASMVITNTDILENIVSDTGGGIFNWDSAIINHCNISGNSATWSGGGIVNRPSAILVMNYATISENIAHYGSGIYNGGSSTISHSTITNNYASNTGGGFHNEGSASLLISHSVISGNNASNTGGGIHNEGIAVLNIDNSTITGNAADNYGDGIFNKESVITTIENCNLDNLDFNIYLNSTTDVNAPNNWWGTTDTDLINQSIHDFYDDFSLGKVLYMPFQTSPIIEDGSGLQQGAPWPMFRQNVRHTGLSPYDTSGNNGELKWSFPTGNIIESSSPSIDSDGTIYIGSHDNKLYAINPNGTEKWKFTAGYYVTSSPAIGSDGTIYVGSCDNKLYAIHPNGTEKWSFVAGGMVRSSPAISSDGTIYVGSSDHKLYAINPNGTEKWNFNTLGGLLSSPAIDFDGTIYIGSIDKRLYAVNPNGTEKWNYLTGGNLLSSPAIDIDGTIYISSKQEMGVGGKLYAVNPNGTEKWEFILHYDSESSPAIGSDGTIYVGSGNGNLYAVNPNGTEKWSSELSGYGLFSSLAIDSNGIIYIGSFGGELFSINPDGSERWNFTAGDNVTSAAIGSDGTIYFGSRDYNLYAIGSEANNPPVANAGPDKYVTVNQTVYFDGSGSYDPDGDTLTYNWDFGDGNSTGWQSDCNASYVYNVTGDYTVALTVSDGNLTDSDSCVITVLPGNYAPIANAGPDQNTTVNQTVYFNGSGSYDPDGDTLTYNWDFGDGNSTGWRSDCNSSHSYNFTGNYTVTLTVNDGELTGTDSCVVHVLPEDGVGNDSDGDGYNDTEDAYSEDPYKWSGEFNIEITSITLSKYGPSAGEEVTIYTAIENTGDNDCDCVVTFYDGDPESGGTQIGSNITITIPAESECSVGVEWTATAGNYTIYVIVESPTTGEKEIDSLQVTVGEGIQPILVLTTGDINIYRFEPGQERTISVEVTCYLQTVTNVHLVVLDDQNLTVKSITPPRTMTDGDTIKFYLRITAPELPEGVEKLERDILIQAVGDNSVFSNAEELDIVVSESAISFLNPWIIAGGIGTGILASLGVAAAASRRNENWKYLLLLTFAVPLYSRIHGKKTLDNFVRGQVYGHIQSQPGTHFNDIRKTLKLGNGNLAYHLRKLEKEGFIFSKRDKRYRRFYPVGVEVPEEDGIKLSKTQENILDYIEQHPRAGQKEIIKALEESQQTVSYNINVLVREGFLREDKIKGIKRYEILEENT